jgi:hypothetical protein
VQVSLSLRRNTLSLVGVNATSVDSLSQAMTSKAKIAV